MERRLGRGLGSLLGVKEGSDGPQTTQELPLDQIRPNRFQPREHFDDGALAELATSIREHGLLQPVVVRRLEGGFELISGERRLRASRLAGRSRILAIVRAEVTDAEMLELALVENVQRQDLDAMERARGFARMIEQLHMTQERVAERVGLKRATVANHLRLLELPDPVQQGIAKGMLTMGHARALLAVPTPKAREQWMARIVRDDLSVRQVEELVRSEAKRPARAATGAQVENLPPAWASDLEQKLRQRLGTKVRLRVVEGFRGELAMEFYGREDLDRLVDALLPTDRLA